MDTTEGNLWHRSSRCEAGDCVEVAHLDGAYAIRDSADPDGQVLRFSAAEWSAFVAGVRACEFD